MIMYMQYLLCLNCCNFVHSACSFYKLHVLIISHSIAILAKFTSIQYEYK